MLHAYVQIYSKHTARVQISCLSTLKLLSIKEGKWTIVPFPEKIFDFHEQLLLLYVLCNREVGM